MTFEQLKAWAEKKGLETDADTIIVAYKDKTFYLHEDGQVTAQFMQKGMHVRVIIGDNKNIEQLRWLILGLEL